MTDVKKTSEFDAYRSSYAETVNDSIAFSGLKVDYFAKAKALRLLELISEKIGDPAKVSVLDVGCGVGTYQPLLRGHVGSISGADPSSECVAEARIANPGVDYRDFDGDVLPFEDNSVDVSFAICVMHHVPPAHWPSFTREMARVTRPGGIVAIFEHNPLNPLTRHIVSRCPFDADAVLLSKRTTEKHLREAGLSGVGGRYILAVPAIDGFMRKVDDALSILPFGAQYYSYGIAR